MVKFLFTAVLTAFSIYSPNSFSDRYENGIYYVDATLIPYTYGSCSSGASGISADDCLDILQNTYGSDYIVSWYKSSTLSSGKVKYYAQTQHIESGSVATGKGTWLETTSGETYVCEDPDYPMQTSDGTECYNSYIIDGETIAAYEQTLEEFQGTAEIMSSDLDENLSTVEQMKERFNELLGEVSLANSQGSAISNISDAADSKALANPESSTVQDASTELADIEFSTETALSFANSSLDTFNDLTDFAESAYSEQSGYVSSIYDDTSNMEVLIEQWKDCTNSSCYESVNNLVDDEIESAANNSIYFNTSDGLTDTYIDNNYTNIVSDISTSVSTVNNNYSDATNIYNSIENYESYGETCVADTCVANPSPDDEETEGDQVYELPTDSENLKFNEILDESTLSELQTNIANKETEYQELIDSFGTLFSSDSFQIADSGYIDNVHDMYGTSIDLGSKQMETLFTQYNLQYIIWFIVVLAGVFILFGVSR